MSVPRTCPACINGNHAAHHYAWNLNRWIGRGCYCPCEGDCTILPNPVARMFAAYAPKRVSR
jgi:hypothetical protein